MSDEQSYDLIIIGTGAGGGTLAYKLAPTEEDSDSGAGHLFTKRESELECD